MRLLFLVLGVLVVVVCAACPSLKPGTDVADAGGSVEDSGGPPPMDAMPPEDTGPPPEDTEPPPEDTEPPPEDAGWPTIMSGDLVINEIMTRPGGTAQPQWVEVVNTSANALNLIGCTLRMSDTESTTITMDFVLAAGQIGVVTSSPTGSALGEEHVAAGLVVPPLSNVKLNCGVDIDAVNLDVIEFPDPQIVLGDGQSIQLDSAAAIDATENDIGAEWCGNRETDSASMYSGTNYGTPGGPNRPCNAPDFPGAEEIFITEIMVETWGSDSQQEWFEVRAIGNSTTIDLAGCEFRSETPAGTLAETHTIPTSSHVLIRPGRYVVFGQSGVAFRDFSYGDIIQFDVRDYLSTYGPDLLDIFCGATVDSVAFWKTGGTYNHPIRNDPGDSARGSIILENNAETSGDPADNNDAADNWCTETSGSSYSDSDGGGTLYGTPGTTAAPDCQGFS